MIKPFLYRFDADIPHASQRARIVRLRLCAWLFRSLLLFVLSVLLLTIAACSKNNEPSAPLARYDYYFQAFNTAIGAHLFAHATAHDTDLINRANTALYQLFADNAAAWAPYDEASHMQQLNRALARGDAFALTTRTERYLAALTDLGDASDYLFNPLHNALSRAWGFYAEPWPDEPPNTKTLNTLAKQRITAANLILQRDTVATNNPTLQVDFATTAPAFAFDEAASLLADMGITSALLQSARLMRAHGAPANRFIHLNRSTDTTDETDVLTLCGSEALAISDITDKVIAWQGNEYHAFIDPRTGRPANGNRYAAVISDSALRADAASRALMVAGEAWQPVASNMDTPAFFIVDGAGMVHESPMWQARINAPDACDTPL